MLAAAAVGRAGMAAGQAGWATAAIRPSRVAAAEMTVAGVEVQAAQQQREDDEKVWRWQQEGGWRGFERLQHLELAESHAL